MYPSYPIIFLDRPFRLQEVEAPRISRQSAHGGDKVVSHTHRLPLPPRRYPWYSFLLEAERPQCQSAAGRIKSMKSHKDPIGNGTRDLSACSAVTQPPAPPRAPILCYILNKFLWVVVPLVTSFQMFLPTSSRNSSAIFPFFPPCI
jgi:hypothetical protein